MGVVVEILYEMLQHFCKETSMQIGDVTIFDMLYADDCKLFADTPENISLSWMWWTWVSWLYDRREMMIVVSAGHLGYSVQEIGEQEPWTSKLKDAGLKASFRKV